LTVPFCVLGTEETGGHNAEGAEGGAQRSLSCGLGAGSAGDEVDFKLQVFFFPTGALQHAAAGFNHAGMTAEISSGVGRSQIPNFNILADQVVDAAKFAMPFRVIPGAADCGNIFEPGCLGSDFFKFIAIAEFVGMAGAMDAKEAVLAGHRRAALFPILKNRTDITDVGCNSRDGAKEHVISVTALKIESEAALGEAPEIEGIILLEDVEERSKLAGGNMLDEEFEGPLVG